MQIDICVWSADNKMDRVEENIRRLLDGRAIEDSGDLCDFTLEEQNEAIGNLNSFWSPGYIIVHGHFWSKLSDCRYLSLIAEQSNNMKWHNFSALFM